MYLLGFSFLAERLHGLPFTVQGWTCGRVTLVLGKACAHPHGLCCLWCLLQSSSCRERFPLRPVPWATGRSAAGPVPVPVAIYQAASFEQLLNILPPPDTAGGWGRHGIWDIVFLPGSGGRQKPDKLITSDVGPASLRPVTCWDPLSRRDEAVGFQVSPGVEVQGEVPHGKQ